MTTGRGSRLAWGVLAYNVGVILWGAYVRATGSGAGCGGHWPLCNGAVVPAVSTAATAIEFSHRLSSGLALAGVLLLAVQTWRDCAPGHPARTGAAFSVLFILTEAALGAALVLFALVADNASVARALFMALHLVNTFALVASLTLTAHWLSGGAPLRPSKRPGASVALAVVGLSVLLAGASGAVAALGDTLYPSGSLAEALRADLSQTSQALIRMRVLHPTIAIVVGFGIVGLVRTRSSVRQSQLGTVTVGLVIIQIALGGLNTMLLAPVWLQLVHLLVADLMWIALVLLAASVLAERREPARQVANR
jgi:heme A synthase